MQPDHVAEPRPSRRVPWLTLVATGGFGGVAGAVWFRGGAAEDAYILFKYARMVAAGQGIAYYPGGPRSEGATDFLWMTALAFTTWLGLVPALAAAAFNAAGFAYVVQRFAALARPAASVPARGLVWLALVTMLSMPFAVAGLVGFGATAYAALALATYVAYSEGKATWVPWLALSLALFRPDGAILAGAFALLQLWQWRRLPRAVPMAWTAAALVGATYFGWRARYFGELLPLPLVVKGHFALPAPGVEDLRDWLASTTLPLLLFLACVWLAWRRPHLARLEWLALLPFVLHLAAFLHTTPTQNVANRFEAPAELVFTYVAVRAALRAAVRTTPLRAALPVAGFIVVWLARLPVVTPELTAAVTRTHYVTRFAPPLAQIARAVPAARRRLRLATTEAGRLAYDLDGPVLDLVGLCSPATAKVPPSFALLDSFDPDVLVVHPAGAIDEVILDGGPRRQFFEVPVPLVPTMWPAQRARAVASPAPYTTAPFFGDAPPGSIENTRGAPPPTLAWLDAHRDRFTLFAVGIPARQARYHLVAIRRDLAEHDELRRALQDAATAAPLPR